MKFISAILRLALFASPSAIFAVDSSATEDVFAMENASNTNNNMRRLGGHHRIRNSTPSQTIEEIVAPNKSFETLTSLLIATGLAPNGLLNGMGDDGMTEYTVFAPFDRAFTNTFTLYPGLDTFLTQEENKEVLTQVLAYHVLGAKVLAGDIPLEEDGGVTTTTVAGDADEITAFKSCYTWFWFWTVCDVYLQDGSPDLARVTYANKLATNGVIHAIDKVLIPPSLADTVESLRDPNANLQH